MQRTHEKGVPAGIAVPMSRQAKMAWVVSPCMRISGHGGAQLHVYVHQHVGVGVQAQQLRAVCESGCAGVAVAHGSAVVRGAGTGVRPSAI